MRTLTISFITFICGVAVACVALAFAAEKPLGQFSHSVWRTENGLPQNTVRAITQTRDGYIWLATDDGLVRFDGIRLTIFDRQNTPAIKSSVILTVKDRSEEDTAELQP